ncbi:MAG: SsrA-binding protein SmpB [Erysipelotrichaceae bacterium]|nr:SsrA-binding protein SmpB [Erysipelotrichaceae bacterium]
MLKLITNNKKASFEYFIIERYEAGIELIGSEVKAIREKSCSIAESYIQVRNGELYIYNLNIPEYTYGNLFNHDPLRVRKLLMHKKEILKMSLKVKKDGMTIIPLKMYFNNDNRVKVEIALAKGKHTVDKRASIKEKDIHRDILKNHKDR